jgi:hypothetical protein
VTWTDTTVWVDYLNGISTPAIESFVDYALRSLLLAAALSASGVPGASWIATPRLAAVAFRSRRPPLPDVAANSAQKLTGTYGTERTTLVFRRLGGRSCGTTVALFEGRMSREANIL